MKTYKVEMRGKRGTRDVEADQWIEANGWLIFSRFQPQGGPAQAFLRVRVDYVVSMLTTP